MEYKIVLVRDVETKWFVAEVPSLPGCISQGKTKSDALNNIKDAIKGYLESLKKHPEERVLDKELKPEFIERLRKIEKEKTIKINDVDEYFKKLASC